MYKDNDQNRQPFFTPDPLPAFHDNLLSFLRRKIPCELFVLYYPVKCPELDGWLEEVISKDRVLTCLEDLYSQYKILPASVLLILATTKHLNMTRPQTLRRTSRQRSHDRKILDAALKVMGVYNAASLFMSSDGLLLNKAEMEQEKVVENYLKRLKHAISKIGRPKKSDTEMRFCAQTLEDFFRQVTDAPLHEQVGSLLVNAFGWPRGKSDLRLAALQHAKGPSINARRSTLQEALDL
jgi:hypothetical protein